MLFFFSGVRGKISLKKKSGIFVSFPFSTLRSEMWSSTLPILFYVNVGVAENCFVAKNNAVSFSVVLRAGVKYVKSWFYQLS